MVSSKQGTPVARDTTPDRPVVFIPVSGPSGAGEYFRCVAIAEALLAVTPTLPIHFIINAETNLRRDERFHYHTTPGAPTHHTGRVISQLQHLRPAAVVFDSSIRTRQLAAGRTLGAAVVALVSRTSKRRRLLQPFKLRHVDSVWIVGAPRPQQRIRGLEKLLTLGWKGRLSFGGTVLSPPHEAELPEMLEDDGYVLVAPGGGGGVVNGQRADQMFFEIASTLAHDAGLPVLFVPGPLSQVVLPANGKLSSVRSLSPGGLRAAISHARLCILGGGSILGQGLALGKPCIPVAAGGRDQPQRITQLACRDLLQQPADNSVAGIAATATNLWKDEQLRTGLSRRVQAAEYADSAASIADDVLELVANSRIPRDEA